MSTEPKSLNSTVFTILEGFTLPADVRKLLEAAYYHPSNQQSGCCLNCEALSRELTTLKADHAVSDDTSLQEVIDGLLQARSIVADLEQLSVDTRYRINQPVLRAIIILRSIAKAVSP